MKIHPLSAPRQRRRIFPKRPACVLGLLVCAALCGPLAHAREVYAYLGSDFSTASGVYSTSDFISGVFTTLIPLGPNLVDQPITPSSYSFSDGVYGFTALNSTASYVKVTTDAYGTLLGASVLINAIRSEPPWSSELFGGFIISPGGDEVTNTNATTTPVLNSAGYNAVAGKWGPDFDPPDTPEPATGFLTPTALLAVAFGARKRIATGLRQPTSMHHC